MQRNIPIAVVCGEKGLLEVFGQNPEGLSAVPLWEISNVHCASEVNIKGFGEILVAIGSEGEGDTKIAVFNKSRNRNYGLGQTQTRMSESPFREGIQFDNGTFSCLMDGPVLAVSNSTSSLVELYDLNTPHPVRREQITLSSQHQDSLHLVSCKRVKILLGGDLKCLYLWQFSDGSRQLFDPHLWLECTSSSSSAFVDIPNFLQQLERDDIGIAALTFHHSRSYMLNNRGEMQLWQDNQLVRCRPTPVVASDYIVNSFEYYGQSSNLKDNCIIVGCALHSSSCQRVLVFDAGELNVLLEIANVYCFSVVIPLGLDRYYLVLFSQALCSENKVNWIVDGSKVCGNSVSSSCDPNQPYRDKIAYVELPTRCIVRGGTGEEQRPILSGEFIDLIRSPESRKLQKKEDKKRKREGKEENNEKGNDKEKKTRAIMAATHHRLKKTTSGQKVQESVFLGLQRRIVDLELSNRQLKEDTENKLIALSFLRDSIQGVRGPSFASRMGDRLQTIIPHEVKNHKSSTQASSSTYSINNSHQTRDIANILVEKITAKLHNHNLCVQVTFKNISRQTYFGLRLGIGLDWRSSGEEFQSLDSSAFRLEHVTQMSGNIFALREGETVHLTAKAFIPSSSYVIYEPQPPTARAAVNISWCQLRDDTLLGDKQRSYDELKKSSTELKWTDLHHNGRNIVILTLPYTTSADYTFSAKWSANRGTHFAPLQKNQHLTLAPSVNNSKPKSNDTSSKSQYLNDDYNDNYNYSSPVSILRCIIRPRLEKGRVVNEDGIFNSEYICGAIHRACLVHPSLADVYISRSSFLECIQNVESNNQKAALFVKTKNDHNITLEIIAPSLFRLRVVYRALKLIVPPEYKLESVGDDDIPVQSEHLTRTDKTHLALKLLLSELDVMATIWRRHIEVERSVYNGSRSRERGEGRDKKGHVLLTCGVGSRSSLTTTHSLMKKLLKSQAQTDAVMSKLLLDTSAIIK